MNERNLVAVVIVLTDVDGGEVRDAGMFMPPGTTLTEFRVLVQNVYPGYENLLNFLPFSIVLIKI